MTEHDTRRAGDSPPESTADLAGTTLTATDFAQFFRDVHGHDPFPWQIRLTSHVIERQAWPKVMDLPTGSGKTAVLDTALFALAARPVVFPRRIVFVIDRRIVVDQVYERAEKIKHQITTGTSPILEKVRSRLSELCDEPLGVAALRGGIPIDGDWAGRPDQPWVVVSTVDQFGSRLLFRGYGVGKRSRPIHAGLTGNDSLVILDEVHLSAAFSDTLAAVRKLNAASLDGLPCRFHVVEMSATPRDAGQSERFTLDPETDFDECAELRRRIQVKKSAELVSVPNMDSMPARILKIVRSIQKSDESVQSVGVVVNRVRSAREIHQALKCADLESHLITGRMRPLDREDVIRRIIPIVDPITERPTGGLTIVVATQAIEVGADFSFDALITECAAVDSLRQRFGRLDRRGSRFARTGVAARAWIIGPKSVVTSKKPDPIYGDATKVTWEQLNQRVTGGKLDIGPLSLSGFPEDASARKTVAPLLLKTHLDAWVQTNPEPLVQPDIDWFLHGIPEDRTPIPDVSIVWRRDLSPEVLRLVPPRSAEALQVPIDAARAWLTASEEADVADVVQQSNTSRSPQPRHISDCHRWEGFDKLHRIKEAKDIRPGDLLIVDTARGGLVDGTWGPASTESVTDLGDAAQVAHRRRATLRLDPRLLGASDVPLPCEEAEAEQPAIDRITELLSQWQAQTEERPAWMVEAINRFMGQRGSTPFDVTAVGIDGKHTSDGYYVLSERKRKAAIDPGTMDGSDEAGSLTGTEVSLDRHLQGVANRVRCWAERLGFSPKLADDLHLAGLLHDIGKVDPRFQAILVGGDPIKLALLDAPIAKSSPGVRQKMYGQQGSLWSTSRRRHGYPRGMRHELASVVLAESKPEVLNLAHDGDLVLHLIGTHHGWGRPLPPVIDDPEPEVLTFRFGGNSLQATSQLAEGPLALEMADRFWRLVARYGYYGLAWLEATFRLADHQQSASEAD